MLLKAARAIDLLLAAMLSGNESASLVALHPALDTLAPLQRIAAGQAVYRGYGKIMPL